MKYKLMIDCEGIAIESGEAFKFACCDCGLVHNIALVSEDGKPIGFAVQRNKRATAGRRKRAHRMVKA